MYWEVINDFKMKTNYSIFKKIGILGLAVLNSSNAFATNRYNINSDQQMVEVFNKLVVLCNDINSNYLVPIDRDYIHLNADWYQHIYLNHSYRTSFYKMFTATTLPSNPYRAYFRPRGAPFEIEACIMLSSSIGGFLIPICVSCMKHSDILMNISHQNVNINQSIYPLLLKRSLKMFSVLRSLVTS